jgi:hypothetical protein
LEWTVPENDKPENGKKTRWLWPLGLAATAVTGAAVVVLRGCWHSKMSWPISTGQCAYQVCLGCGIKRLFDERNFRGYGPYHYDLEKLIAWERTRAGRAESGHQDAQRPASWSTNQRG